MYALRLVEQASRCSLCKTQIAGGGLVGHCYEQPLCERCFGEAAPEVAAAWSSLGDGGESAESLRKLEDPTSRCFICGRRIGAWVGGFVDGTLLCRACFSERAPHLTALLILDDGVRWWRASQRGAAELVRLAEGYAEVMEAG